MERIFPMIKIILSLNEHDCLYKEDWQHEHINMRIQIICFLNFF